MSIFLSWVEWLKAYYGTSGGEQKKPAIATTKATSAAVELLPAEPEKKTGTYRVKFYTGSYNQRQADANRDGAICFVAHHFNAAESPAADYALCVVADNASAKSRAWAADYVERVSRNLAVRKYSEAGVCIGGMNGRGNEQIKYTAMPAILVEPLFCSNPSHANIIKLASGRYSLAMYLADSIRAAFPLGGLVAFSVGHKYKPAPHGNDRGAALHGGGTEADYAEMVLQEAARMLEGV